MGNCVHCGCGAPMGDAVHRIVEALARDDVDRAIDLGLLDDVACGDCTPECRVRLDEARDVRRRALAARERFRDRNLRLEQRARERDARRAPVASDAHASKPTLPPAAAAALERAKARAAQRKPE